MASQKKKKKKKKKTTLCQSWLVQEVKNSPEIKKKSMIDTGSAGQQKKMFC